MRGAQARATIDLKSMIESASTIQKHWKLDLVLSGPAIESLSGAQLYYDLNCVVSSLAGTSI